MRFLSFQFWLFVFVGTLIYYILPKKCQWGTLLVMSVAFYVTCGSINMLPFFAITIIAVWGGALLEERVKAHYSILVKEQEDKESKKLIKKKAKNVQKAVLAIVFLIVIGQLIYLKYSGFLFGIYRDDIILPLGISYYTLQCIGYFLNVYWGKNTAEKNILKVALFAMFFPQIIQGPIAKWNQLSEQFYKTHFFDLEKVEKAIILMLWGFLKKTTIADNIGPLVSEVFNNSINYGFKEISLTLLLYSAQLYADFSGGIDIVTGVAELFDIELECNFRRPFLSESLSEFWRRWHISLGAWMKEYVYYPIAAAKWMTNSVTFLKKKCNANIAKAFALIVGNVVVFLLVGLWHGAAWHYVAWGLYNGLIISFADISRPYFVSFEDKMHISQDSKVLKCFRILITFIIVNVSWILDRSYSAPDAIVMTKQMFTWSQGNDLMEIIPVFYISLAALIIVGLYQEITGKSVRDTLWNMKLPIRWLILLVFLIYFATFAGIDNGMEQEFLYAVF